MYIPCEYRKSQLGEDHNIIDASSFSKKELKYESEEKGSSLCKCSILLGFFMSKKLERLCSELLSEDKITNLLVFLT